MQDMIIKIDKPEHVYLVLKKIEETMPDVMWKSGRKQSSFKPTNGCRNIAISNNALVYNYKLATSITTTSTEFLKDNTMSHEVTDEKGFESKKGLSIIEKLEELEKQVEKLNSERSNLVANFALNTNLKRVKVNGSCLLLYIGNNKVTGYFEEARELYEDLKKLFEGEW